MNTIFSQAPIAICILKGKTFRVESTNELYLQLINKGQHFIGKDIFDSLPELEGQGIREMLNGVLETGEPFIGNELEVFLIKNGKKEKSYFNFIYQPLREEDGIVSGIIVVCTEVTSIVHSKNRLKESENRFRSLVAQSPIPMTIFNGPDFIIDTANDALLKKIWKKKLTEVQGKKLLEVFPELQSQQFPKLLKQVYETGIIYKENEAIAYVDSPEGMNAFYLDFEYAPLFDAEKNVFAIMVTVNDVTEKVEARKKIADAEERARLAIDSSELGTFDLNTITDELICSPRYFEIFGFEHAVTHKECLDRLHPEDLSIREEAFKNAKKGDKLFYEMRILKEQSQIAWIRIEGKIFYDANGQPTRILGTLRDITERKKTEEELKLSFEKFRLLADSMPQFVWTGTPSGELNYFNQSVFKYSGLSREHFINDGWLQIIHPNDREENIRKWKEAIETGNDFWMEHRFCRYDGVYRWQLSRAIPQRNASGEIQMWVGTSTDIHDQKTSSQRLEELVEERTKELKQANVELESMNQELASFAYISSHDLQEPLRKIQTFASRILESEKQNLSAQGKNYFSRMQNAANRMQTLINDLLTYSRANSEEKIFEKTDLNSLLNEVKNEFSETLIEKNGNIQFDTLPIVKGIPFQLRQLFINLISNSIKFSRNDVPLKIEINSDIVLGSAIDNKNAHKEDYYFHIKVKDNGIGFEDGHKFKIFEVFQRLHNKTEYDGTGIGLSICKKIVENHQGIISANSGLQKGATFNIYFPVLN